MGDLRIPTEGGGGGVEMTCAGFGLAGGERKPSGRDVLVKRAGLESGGPGAGDLRASRRVPPVVKASLSLSDFDRECPSRNPGTGGLRFGPVSSLISMRGFTLETIRDEEWAEEGVED